MASVREAALTQNNVSQLRHNTGWYGGITGGGTSLGRLVQDSGGNFSSPPHSGQGSSLGAGIGDLHSVKAFNDSHGNCRALDSFLAHLSDSPISPAELYDGFGKLADFFSEDGEIPRRVVILLAPLRVLADTLVVDIAKN
jgi:hypothetical protein